MTLYLSFFFSLKHGLLLRQMAINIHWTTNLKVSVEIQLKPKAKFIVLLKS